ncbi:MAG: hypothetical protein JST53_16330 [Actinobacteria bacterium]|nr:hypothetical protein [Actinomycetota bacterium]
MRSTALAAIVLSAALLAAGCGGGGSGGSNSTAAPQEGGAPKTATAPNAPAGSKVVICGQGLRSTAVDCATAERLERRWEKHRSCALPDGASRGSCALGPFRCQAVRSGNGVAVSCARPGGDIAFIAKGSAGG